jgi:nucleotide-binding universal stress UspA family protein
MLAIKNVLFATDFSDNSKIAFRVACALARDYGAHLVIMHVAAPLIGFYGEGAVIPEPQAYEDSLREELELVRPTDPNVPVEYQLAEGDAASEILRIAKECKADVIVLGTHGRSGISRLLMGSVAETVLRRAPCPVLTVKAPLAEEEPEEEHAFGSSGTAAPAGSR